MVAAYNRWPELMEPFRHDPPAALHVWRRLTTIFMEMEVAMLIDLGRVAASVLKRAR